METSDRCGDIVLLGFLSLLFMRLPYVSGGGGLIQGSPISCNNEGMEVEVPWISNDPCISCNCQSKEVVCQKEACPSVKSCYFVLFEHKKKSCCDICKSCTHKGQTYLNGQEWKDPDDPCTVLSCLSGVVTETTLRCYTPCRTPEPPLPGTCCPTCPGCQSEDDEKSNNFLMPMPLTDPCVTCMCTNGSMVCTKKACPVLPCPQEKYRYRTGSCCPECYGSRRVYQMSGSCLLGMQAFKNGEELRVDTCTSCMCNDSTSFCSRSSCPPLDCWPEQQVKDPEDCCPKCRAPEEKNAVCVVHGKSYQDGDRWKMEKCTHCQCRDGHVHCAVDPCDINITCPPGYTIKTLPGECCPSCIEGDRVCTVFGDPHYKTFDGMLFNYQGSCKYVLAKDCKSKSFSVEVLNDSRYSKAFSWTKSVTIKVNGTKIRLGQNMKIHVNHKPVKIPYIQLGVLSVHQEEYNIQVRTNIGVKVYWDGNSFLEVSVPSKFKGKLCGLCGNFNDKKEDDFQIRGGKLASNAVDFGNSWRVGRMKRCGLAPSSQNEPACRRNWDIRVRAIKECNVLKSALFKSCHRVVSAVPYYRSCLVDTCECRPRDKCYCESLAAYSRECARAGSTLAWRNSTGCDGDRCTNGERFMQCAPACRRTCKKPTRDKSCRRPCRPGCYCPPGTVWHKKRCIALDECPAKTKN